MFFCISARIFRRCPTRKSCFVAFGLFWLSLSGIPFLFPVIFLSFPVLAGKARRSPGWTRGWHQRQGKPGMIPKVGLTRGWHQRRGEPGDDTWGDVRDKSEHDINKRKPEHDKLLPAWPHYRLRHGPLLKRAAFCVHIVRPCLVFYRFPAQAGEWQ